MNLNNIINTIKGLNLSSVVSNTNKTLNVIKKSIPVYKEIRPYIRKEKSLFNNKKNIEENIIKEPLHNKDNINDSLTFFN